MLPGIHLWWWYDDDDDEYTARLYLRFYGGLENNVFLTLSTPQYDVSRLGYDADLVSQV